jgi:putative autotransporter adhesin-like protein
MKIFLVAFAAIVVAPLATIATVSLTRSATAGAPVHEERAVSGFHRLDISGQATVELVQGATEGVTVDAPASARVRTEVRDETLVIEVEDRRRVWQWFPGSRSSRAVRLKVNLRDIDSIEAAGAVAFVADRLKSNELELAGACSFRVGDLQATALKLDGSGATKVQLGGKVVRQQIDLSGAGSYEAARLASDDATIDVSGAGKAVVNARNALSVDISGAGKVEYLGDPQLRQSISGIGKVSRRNAS